MTMNTVYKAIVETANAKSRSRWMQGVKDYAFDLLAILDDNIDILAHPEELERVFLNGASSWSEYSWGGCSLIYDPDIAARLCTPSEYKRTKAGSRRPNASEEWLDVQARALFQAFGLILEALANIRTAEAIAC